MSNEQNALFSGVGAQSVSQREFAEIVGKSESLIRKYLRQGKLAGDAIVIITGKPNRLNLDVALQQWRTFHPEHSAGGPDDNEDNPRAMTEMQAASLRRALAQAEREEMELSILKGTHIHIDDIRSVFAPLVENAKHKLYTIEDKLVARLPGNPVENGRIIRQVIDEICKELTYVDPKPTKRRRRTTPAQ